MLWVYKTTSGISSLMATIDYKKATFLLSAAKLTQLPADSGVEVAFVGRSNAGKSSVLNQLTHNKKLARVSKTPGRTQLINIFPLDAQRRLIDLPGYGYAKVPEEIKLNWQETLAQYLKTRTCLRGVVLVMDIRHPLTPFDRHLLSWANECDLAVHILLNKSDKLAYGAMKKTVMDVKKFMTTLNNEITCQPFSALKNTGTDELRDKLDQWFELPIVQDKD